MSLSSAGFLLFAPLAWGVYLAARGRHRWLVLLAASVLLYACYQRPALLAMLGLVTGLNYVAALLMGADETGAAGARVSGVTAKRRAIFVTAVAVNVGALVAAKAVGFLPSSVGRLYGAFVGVSFYTFQGISYLAEVYLGRAMPERNLGHFALYMSFFPKIAQGPIERFGTLMPQLKALRRPTYADVRAGCLMFATGLFRKVVLADRLGVYVDRVFTDVHSFGGGALVLATYLYALQIYFDFSGYTKMALGAARLFGIELTDNFNRPYLARSVADFWRRWHISLSTWIADYLFRPLQMAFRRLPGALGNAAALVITFTVCGLWHGFGWGFIVWGCLHGTYMAASVLTQRRQKLVYKRLGIQNSRVKDILHTIVTVNLVCLAWVFFRASSIADAWYVLTHLFSRLAVTPLGDVVDSQRFPLTVLLSLVTIVGEGLLARGELAKRVAQRPAWVRWPAYCALVVSIYMLGAVGSGAAAFIYAQF